MFTSPRIIFLLVFLTSFVCTSPIFFEIYETSTKQEVISDYRQAGKRLDHAEENERHVEFYAEIIGKLVGSLRSGIKTFIEDVRKVKRDKNQLDDIVNKTENNSTENKYENSTQKLQSVHRTAFNEQNVCEDIDNLTKDDTKHNFLCIFNDAMISILTLIPQHFNGHYKNSSARSESCINILKDHVTILETIRIYKIKKNTKYQQKAKLTLRRIFYKYARIYLRARKGYKDHQTSHHDDLVRQNAETEKLNFFIILENIDLLNFTTNDAPRHSFKSIESIAILILEIFGALIALALGLWTHLEQLDFNFF